MNSDDLVNYSMSKKLPIPEDMMERFNDFSNVDVTLKSLYESALVVSAHIGNDQNYEYIKNLIQAEDSIKNNHLFKEYAEFGEKIKEQFAVLTEDLGEAPRSSVGFAIPV